MSVDFAQQLGESFCRDYLILPIPELSDRDSLTKVLICDETQKGMLDFAAYKIGSALQPVPVPRESLLATLQETFHISESNRKSSTNSESGLSVVDTLQQALTHAVSRGASDIHIESMENGVTLRERIDGVLSVSGSYPSDKAPELFSRIKILAGLDIAERRRPQDGRLSFDGDLHGVDIRVSLIPTDRGEKAVLRLLDPSRQQRSLDALGFLPEQVQILRESLKVPNGIVLVTGPTGSGKTTTLYAALSELRDNQVNISTIEDPIEYRLEGINQTQVRPTIGLSFATMLRALLRQDPNIILVGEIRDKETLDIAIRASLTGHLVLSTLHTNSAVSTMTRMIDMGAESYLLSSALRLIVAQRLVRRVCEHCKMKEHRIEEMNLAKKLDYDVEKLMYGQGCQKCRQTGFRGRIALSEMMVVDDTLRKGISEKATEAELSNIAMQSSFRAMSEIGKELVERGLVTPSEVYRELHVA